MSDTPNASGVPRVGALRRFRAWIVLGAIYAADAAFLALGAFSSSRRLNALTEPSHGAGSGSACGAFEPARRLKSSASRSKCARSPLSAPT